MVACLQDLARLCSLPEDIICHASVCKCMCTCRVQVHVQCAGACAHAGPFGVVRLVGVCKCMCNCSVHVQCASTCFAHKCVRMWVHVKCTHTHRASVCRCMCTCRVQVHVQCASACAHAGPFGVVRLVGVCKCMCNCSVHVQCASTCLRTNVCACGCMSNVRTLTM